MYKCVLRDGVFYTYTAGCTFRQKKQGKTGHVALSELPKASDDDDDQDDDVCYAKMVMFTQDYFPNNARPCRLASVQRTTQYVYYTLQIGGVGVVRIHKVCERNESRGRQTRNLCCYHPPPCNAISLLYHSHSSFVIALFD